VIFIIKSEIFKNHFKKYAALLLLLILIFTSCSKKEEPVIIELPEDSSEDIIPPPPVIELPSSDSEAETDTEPDSETDAEPDLTGLAVNSLTGLYINEEAARQRPVAVVINNLRKALPQSGISQADIYYEVLSEADITRIVAVFRDFNSAKIGPVRSTRDYFLDFGLDMDAVFVHFGGSPAGYTFIKSNRINNIDGITDGRTFWRDQARASVPGMLEHSAYTSAERITQEIERREYRTEVKENYASFNFFDEQTPLDGATAVKKVTVPFSNSQSPVFEYNPETSVFARSQQGGAHIDEETGTQLEVTNIIIQNASMKVVDNEGRRQVSLVTQGSGYLVTHGGYAPITWAKTSHDSPTKYYDTNGEEIKLNKGKTWICVFQDYGEVIFES
jgi:hypothetical protein